MQILWVTLLVGCTTPPSVGVIEGTGSKCNDCQKNEVCVDGSCRLPCLADDDCGSCSECRAGYCEQFAEFCILAVDPKNGAVAVASDLSAIKVVFSSKVAENSLSQKVKLTDVDNELVATNNLVSGANLTVKISEKLKNNTKYRLFIDEQVRSAEDYALAEDFVSSFTTAGQEGDDGNQADKNDEEVSNTTSYRYGVEVVSGRTGKTDLTIDVLGGGISGQATGGEVELKVGLDNNN